MMLDGEANDYSGASDGRVREEHPSVVLSDLATRRRPQGHVIAFANEKGGVGKSTLAFHCAVALAHRGLRVLVVDCDRRQKTLDRFLQARDGTARTLKVALPRPQHLVLEQQTGAVLAQEIERAGAASDVVLIDLAGQDSPLARRAIGLADTLVTPVNCSPTDLDALGWINPVTHRFRQAGPFAEVVAGLRAERLARGLPAFDWIVAKNRVRHCERRLIGAVDANLATMARHLGFRTIDALTERVGYRELMPFGLTQFDLKLLPELGAARSINMRELRRLVEELRLPWITPGSRAGGAKAVAPVTERTAQNYREAIAATVPARAATV